MKKQNNKTKTKTTIIASLIIGLIILSPTTMLPNVGASTVPVSTQSNPPQPQEADKLQEKISKEVKKHPEWIGLLSWNKTSAKIDYLGPADESPFLIKNDYNPFSGQPISVLKGTTTDPKISSDPQTLNVGDAVSQATGAGGTAIGKIREDYNLHRSTPDLTINHIQILNSMNSNNQRWIQVGTVYDNINQFASTAGWYIIYQVWPIDSSCTGDIPIVNQHSLRMGTWNTNDPAHSIITGTSTAGQYILSSFDDLALLGSSLTVNISGDSGTNTINMGQQNPFLSGCYYPSAAQDEQWTTGSGTYHFVSDQYSYQFTLLSGSTTSSATGFVGKTPNSKPASVTVTEHPSSPASDTFNYP